MRMWASQKAIVAVAMGAILVPGWLYVSGNLPSLFPSNERLIRAVNASWPALAELTFKGSRLAFERLRDLGLEVPYTYNERLMRIARIRARVIRMCNQIIEGDQKGVKKDVSQR